MPDTSGQGQTAAAQTVQNLIAGGVDVHLLTTAVAYGDDAATIGTKSDAAVAVAEVDLTVNSPADFSGTTTLTPDIDIEFGEQSIGVVEDVVVQNTTSPELWLSADETNTPNLTGEQYTITQGTVLYELGNPV